MKYSGKYSDSLQIFIITGGEQYCSFYNAD